MTDIHTGVVTSTQPQVWLWSLAITIIVFGIVDRSILMVLLGAAALTFGFLNSAWL